LQLRGWNRRPNLSAADERRWGRLHPKAG
jgi:hypothetical protein